LWGIHAKAKKATRLRNKVVNGIKGERQKSRPLENLRQRKLGRK